MIHCIIGIPASGKSIYSKNLRNEIGVRAVIVNRDKFREMLFGYTEETVEDYYKKGSPTFQNEKIVSIAQDNLISTYLKQGFDVIIDNTHLKKEHLDALKSYNVPIKYHIVNCDVKLAIERDAKRVRKVGRDKILSMYQMLQHIQKTYPLVDWYPETDNLIINDETKN
jgi:predicted kinase